MLLETAYEFGLNGLTRRAYPGYSGTTLENFLTCAFVIGKTVVFDKTKEAAHHHPEIFCSPSFQEACAYSLARAVELGGHPLTMAGFLVPEYIKTEDDGELILVKGLKWPVNRVFLLREDADLRRVSGYQNPSVFEEYHPRQVLERLAHTISSPRNSCSHI